LTRPFATFLFAIASLSICSARLAAQDEPPRIGPFVIDLHGTIPRFPGDDAQLAQSRELSLHELPGSGLGVHAAANVYVLTWKAMTFGVGVDATVARSHQSQQAISATETGRAVTERFSHIAPDLSFNFGTGDGWSYLSGGIGPAVWSLVPDDAAPANADRERLQTINYGGGARWFLNHRVAFSVDVRFYAINPGTPELGRPGGPRTTLLVIGGGISVK
jgi:hypothetical protein